MNIAGNIDKIRSNLSFERIFFLLFILSIAIRLYQLDLKLFHHDEAVHAWFSYRLLTLGEYVYDPVYHGPLLYYITAGMFRLFGDSDLVARIVPALLGVLLVPLVYCLHRLEYLNPRQALVAALFIILSPDMVYFSRFLRNDIFIVFFSLLLLVALLFYLEEGGLRYAVLAGIAAACGICCKENMPVVIGIFGVFGIYLLWRGAIRLPEQWRRDLLAASIVGAGIIMLMYSSLGQHPEVLLDGWIRAIEHWTGVHELERLGGPPYFYLLLLLLYELPIFALALYATGQFVTSPGEKYKEEIKGILPDKNREFTRFCIFWMILSMAFYAYIGEKVPWLILHQLLPMIFVSVYALSEKKLLIAILSALFLAAMTWHVAFVSEDINEPIVQVQNSEEMRNVMALIDASDRVAVATDSYWPLPWYYRGEAGEKLTYIGTGQDAEYYASGRYDLVITHDTESFPAIQGFKKETFRHSYWFSTYENQDRWLEYYFTRSGSIGSLKWDVFSRIEN